MTNKHPIDVKMGETVRYYRTCRGITQDTLAKHLSITFQQIQKYETGANRISTSKLFAIAECLSMTPSKLIRKVQEGDMPDISDNSEILNLIKNYLASPPSLQKVLMNNSSAFSKEAEDE